MHAYNISSNCSSLSLHERINMCAKFKSRANSYISLRLIIKEQCEFDPDTYDYDRRTLQVLYIYYVYGHAY